MKIAQIKAYPSSFPVKDGPTLGIVKGFSPRIR
jgi:hypothetical protein